MHPEREPLETLHHLRRTLSKYHFAAQFQQSPAPLGGGLVKAAWFKRYRENELPQHFNRIVQSWDTANKATELSDFSVCTTWGVKDKHAFLIGLFRRRLEYPELKRAVVEQQRLFGATVVLIEDQASGTQLIQDLIADRCHGVTRCKTTVEKTMRMHAQTGVIENGFVTSPKPRHGSPNISTSSPSSPTVSMTIKSIRPRSSSIGSGVPAPYPPSLRQCD